MPPCWRWCSLGGAGADAVVPRPGLALGRRADRRAGLLLRRLDGLAHPAHRPGAEPRLSADRHAVPRPRAGARVDRLRRRRRRRRGAASCWGATRWRCSSSISWPRLRLWRILGADQPRDAAARAASLPLAAGAACALRADRRPAAADRAAGRRTPTARRSTTSAPAAARCIRPCCSPSSRRTCSAPRAAWRTTGARRASPGATPACSSPRTWASSTSAPSRCCCSRWPACAGSCGRARSASSPCAAPRHAALCARLVHAGFPRALHAGAGRQPLSPAGRRHLPDRRARRHPGRLCARIGCSASPWRTVPRQSCALASPSVLGAGVPAVDRPGAVARPPAASAAAARHGGAVLRRRRPARSAGRRRASRPAGAGGGHARRLHRPPTLPTTTAPRSPRPCRPPPTTCWSPTPATPPSPS